ncbi:MAG: hypothetical protein ABIF77_21260 [bacterium]
MRCGRAREWLSLTMDSQLPPDKTISLEGHLEKCTGCRSYRDDLLLGQRLLRATEPEVSENFEWRLQLKLNQTLQEAAQSATLPWENPRWSLSRWLGTVGVSMAVSCAVIVALAMLVLPTSPSRDPQGGGTGPAVIAHHDAPMSSSSIDADRTDRRSLLSQNSGSTIWPRPVSLPNSGLGVRPANRGFPNSERFWVEIRNAINSRQAQIDRLRQENLLLTVERDDMRKQLVELKAQLDIKDSDQLDLQRED